jgi:hypothetical protein
MKQEAHHHPAWLSSSFCSTPSFSSFLESSFCIFPFDGYPLLLFRIFHTHWAVDDHPFFFIPFFFCWHSPLTLLLNRLRSSGVHFGVFHFQLFWVLAISYHFLLRFWKATEIPLKTSSYIIHLHSFCRFH